ncbi:MAG: HesA/MoeB/ThiF family protein [Bacteroidia bacterium]|nr:HesA/MoeB/ThiF family protein [Bacteroidia bacterium]MCX7651483.1 HesA/MoeB/ThiF family protein [Bacteroidia bacterium]MDW8416762.1 HesA/MoeB/ThiF family protein [Bacteroidia bacterium]
MSAERAEFPSDRRYLAQSRLPGWRQSAIRNATVLIVGVGGLGCPAALYLAAMGIGRLIIADPDTVAEENLHRQPLYPPTSIGRLKVDALSEYLLSFRPDLVIEKYPIWADSDFLQRVGKTASIWIDGTDNLQSRLAIDEAAYTLHKPWVYGAIFQWEGQVALLAEVSYKELFGESADSPPCSEAGVIGALPGIIGSWQAALAAQYLADPASFIKNLLYRIDLRTGKSEVFEILPRHNLPEIGMEIPAETALQMQSAVWIDIREERMSPLIVPSISYAWYKWDTWDLPSSPIVIVCEAGNRSRQIAYALRRKTGRSDIYSLRGGAATLPR